MMTVFWQETQTLYKQFPIFDFFFVKNIAERKV